MEKRNAIVSFKQLGDIILLEPLARLLSRRGGGTPTDLYTKRAFAPIVGLMPSAQPGRKWSLTQYDELWATHAGWKTTRASFILRARTKTVLFPPESSSEKAIHRVAYDAVITTPTHIDYWAYYYWAQAGGEPGEFRPPELDRPPAHWGSGLDGVPGNYVLCHPTAAWESKFWVPEKWARVIDSLHEKFGAPVVLTSGSAPFERRHCAAILAACRHAPLDLGGTLSIVQYAWVTAHARALIAIDGSACHLADALRVPAVKLFGQTSPERWHYHRPDARVVTSSPDPTPLRPPTTEIPVDAVVEAAAEVLV